MQQAFADQYHSLLWDILRNGHEDLNARTGHRVRCLPGGRTLVVDLSDDRLPLCGHRKLYPHMAAAEVAWFLMGTQEVGPLRDLGCKFWDKFVEVDGRTVKAGYGYRWRKHFGRDQIAHAVEALRRDRSDRQVLVSAWDPSTDGLGNRGTAESPVRNVPCPACFTLSIVDGRLHSTLLIRSSDVVVGLPYDVMGHAMLMATIAASVDDYLTLGRAQVVLAHPHIYDVHYDRAEDMYESYRRGQEGPPLAAVDLETVSREPMSLVHYYKTAAQHVTWPDMQFTPEVIV